jgi:ribonuclease HI
VTASAPHFLLYTDSSPRDQLGDWRFKLQSEVGEVELEVADSEPHTRGDRLALLAAVRGLESLSQPSRITLVTSSEYVTRGVKAGLDQWRQDGWMCDCKGQRVPVPHVDLWLRFNNALRFHQVDCRRWRIDQAHVHSAPATLPQPVPQPVVAPSVAPRKAPPTTLRRRVRRRRLSWSDRVGQLASRCLWQARTLLPGAGRKPWFD